MAISEAYRRQVELLVRVIPDVATEKVFALKGGTAINLFVRDLPRLSVDIDLTYLPVEDRATSLANIEAAMLRLADRIRARLPGCHVAPSRMHKEPRVTKLVVRHEDVQIKIEVTPVTRGCVYPPEDRVLAPAVQRAFGFAEMQVVSFPDLYAGKIVAALDRQHPRDLFDVRDLLRNEGIGDDLRRAFIVYILSHHRPMNEVIGMQPRDIEAEYHQLFVGMTQEDVPLDELLAARRALHQSIVGAMPDDHRRFLMSFKAGHPDWDLLSVPGAANLPAVRWKVENLNRMRPDKRAAELGRLEVALRA